MKVLSDVLTNFCFRIEFFAESNGALKDEAFFIISQITDEKNFRLVEDKITSKIMMLETTPYLYDFVKAILDTSPNLNYEEGYMHDIVYFVPRKLEISFLRK